MVHAEHFLLDDWTLVQVCRDVMRGGSDELHAAVIGLVVRLGTLETGQERMVDVDGTAAEAGAQVVGQDLHVACKDHQVRVVLGHQLQQARFSFGLGSGRYRDVDELQAGGFRHGAKVLVIGHHDGDLRTQAAGAPAEDEVVEAVAEL
ncbi:hypothetical protein D9M72_553880 [compost metagenome]